MTKRRLFVAAAALLLAACASTSIRDSWYDPSYQGGAFKRVFVLGVAPDSAERRTFEDIVVARLRASGVDAVPAYQTLPDADRIAEPRLDEAVRASEADALWMSRVRWIDRRTQVTQTMVPAPGLWGPGWYGMYSGWYPVTDVRQYDVVTVETSVFETKTRMLVWTGVSETYDPGSVAKETPGYTDVIVKALRERGLLPPAR